MIAYLDPYLVDCRLPYRRKSGQSTWPGHGLCVVSRADIPFGDDRGIFLWAATMARTRGLGFGFRPGEVAGMFGVTWSRNDILARLYRISSTHLEVARSESDRHVIDLHPVIERLEVTPDRCSIQLGSLFAPDRLIPIRGEVIVGCMQQRRLAALDLYLWQCAAARDCQLSTPIEVFGPGGLLSRLGCTTRDARKARQQLRTRQSLIKALWPACPHHLTADGNRFVIEPKEHDHAP